MIAINKCFNCDCSDETLLGVCVECVETIMGRLDSLPKLETSRPMVPTTCKKCSCAYGAKGAKEKVELLLADCEAATVRTYERNYEEAKRHKASKR